MSNYKLSIIIPTFNLENNINTAFDSVKSQTIGFENIELIFVDDNSTDNTFEILTEYSNNYDNVNVFKTDENSGFAGKPRNIGLEKSTTEYVLFLDGDDQLLVDSCEVLLKNISTDNSDVTIGSHINRYDNDILEHTPALPLGRKEVFETTNDINLLNITPAISAKLFKKELIVENNIKFIEGIPGEDLVFFVETILNSNKISVLNNQYIYYRNIDVNSVSFKVNEKYLYGLIKAYTLISKSLDKFNIDYNMQEIIFKKHLNFFTSQVLRAQHSNNIDSTTLHQILNSENYDNLSHRPIFKNNLYFNSYYKSMKNGDYTNAKTLINNMKLNINIEINYLYLKNKNEKLEADNEYLKNKNKDFKDHNTILTEQNNNINNKLFELKKEVNDREEKIIGLTKSNERLKKENHDLNNELNNIKSSKLWKLRKKIKK